MLFLTTFLSIALASIDPACQAVADQGAPSDYSEQAQNDFLLNYFSLSTTFSALHAPIPAEPGHALVGLELSVIPPLPCERRLVLSYSKTEETNKAPVLPRPRITVTMPALGKAVPYISLGYVPPVTVFGTRNVIVSGEAGAGVPLGDLQLGGRYHMTLMKTTADVATAFNESDPAYLDFYSGSTWGADVMGGYDLGKVTPYLAAGYTDVSTFFFIGDDDYVGNNCSPYAGPVASLGAQGRFGKIDLGAEVYSAFKNLSPGIDDPACEAITGFAPARLTTGRLRIAYAF